MLDPLFFTLGTILHPLEVAPVTSAPLCPPYATAPRSVNWNKNKAILFRNSTADYSVTVQQYDDVDPA